MGRTWNAATILLLVLIAALVYFMPKFNYDVLVRRHAALESAVNTSLQRLEKVENLLGLGPKNRAAALEVLDALPGRLNLLQEQFSQASDIASLALGEIAALEARVKALQEGHGPTDPEVLADPSTSSEPDSQRWSRPDYTRPVTLPPELAAKAKKIGHGVLADLDTPGFIEMLMDAGILRRASLSLLPPELVDRLHRLHRLCKTNLSVLDATQELYIEEQVERLTREGKFIEIPAPGGPVHATMSPALVGVVHVKIFHETGLQRHFELPLEEHPQIGALNEKREHARDHLILDAARLVEAYSVQDLSSGEPR